MSCKRASNQSAQFSLNSLNAELMVEPRMNTKVFM